MSEQRIPKISTHNKPPEGRAVIGDVWLEQLGCGGLVRWQWDGFRWVHQSDTVKVHGDS